MKNEKTKNLLVAIIVIVIGILCIALQNRLLGALMTGIGVLLIVSGLLDLILAKNVVAFVVKAVIGAAIILLGWLAVTVVLYIIAVLMVIYGILGILQILANPIANVGLKILALFRPILNVVVGVCLFFNQGGTMAWVFIVVGILLVADGILSMASALSE